MKSVDVDKIPIRRDSFLPNAYVIELPLDSQPDYVWLTFFEQEWKSSLDLWERKAVVVGDKLLLITTPTEIGEKIDWLKRVVESTNMRVERFNQTQQVIEKAEKVKVLRKHENIVRDALRVKLSLI
ncbi:MAG: hypothetical protein OEZ18_03690 [Candidatus Bathyarchaeota archaeon]|nr:hypothetical protein [Candidatus Bathyarchaeota archaeon]